MQICVDAAAAVLNGVAVGACLLALTGVFERALFRVDDEDGLTWEI